MLNYIFCVPEEKDSRKRVYMYIVCFFMYVSFGEDKKKTKFAANAALTKWTCVRQYQPSCACLDWNSD